VARQTTGQRDAAESAAEESERPAGVDELWSAVRIDPVEIALPKGVGYTLRAYRPVTEVTPTDISEREEDAFPERARPAWCTCSAAPKVWWTSSSPAPYTT